MATNKKTGGTAKTAKAEKTEKTTKSAGTGGATATMTLPEGFTTGKSMYYAEMVARRFDTLPAGGGVVRLLLVATKDASMEQVRTLLGNPRFGLKMKAPGIWEATVMLKDMEMVVAPNVGADKTFRWVDVANRFFGLPVANPTDMVTVAVAYDGAMMDAKKKLGSLGMKMMEATPPADVNMEEGEWVNPDEGLMVGTMPAAKLYDLALSTKAVSVEVRGVEKQG